MLNLKQWLVNKASNWLTQPILRGDILSPNDFCCLRESIRPADVLLVEGRTRIGHIIKVITRSSWTHSAICIGKLDDIQDAETRAIVGQHYTGDPSCPLLVESELNRGTVIQPLDYYASHHTRICRPTSLLQQDANTI